MRLSPQCNKPEKKKKKKRLIFNNAVVESRYHEKLKILVEYPVARKRIFIFG